MAASTKGSLPEMPQPIVGSSSDGSIHDPNGFVSSAELLLPTSESWPPGPSSSSISPRSQRTGQAGRYTSSIRRVDEEDADFTLSPADTEGDWSDPSTPSESLGLNRHRKSLRSNRTRSDSLASSLTSHSEGSDDGDTKLQSQSITPVAQSPTRSNSESFKKSKKVSIDVDVSAPYGRRHSRSDSITRFMRFNLQDFPAPISIVPGPSSRAARPFSIITNPTHITTSPSTTTSPSYLPESASTPSTTPWYSFVAASTPTNNARLTFAYPQSRLSTRQRLRRSLLSGSVPLWLGLYFVFNLALTLYNKGVLLRFPFPYTLTAIHALCGAIGCYALYARGIFVCLLNYLVLLNFNQMLFQVPAQLDTRQNLVLVAFSFLYTINIAISNVSLQLVTIPVRIVPSHPSPSNPLSLLTHYYSTSSIKSSAPRHHYSQSYSPT